MLACLAGPVRAPGARSRRSAAAALPALPAVAQEVSFTSLTAARECRVLLPDGERIYGGLSDGGVVVWDAADPASTPAGR